MRRRVPVAFAALLLIAACTGSGGRSAPNPAASRAPNAFADATCADLAGWALAVQPVFNDLQQLGTLDINNKAAVQAQLDELSAELGDAIAATTKLSDGISSRPAPEITDGDTIKTTLVSALNSLRDVGQQARATLDAFDVETATPEQAAQLTADLQGSLNSIAEALGVLAPLLSENQELRSALENSATCQQAGSDIIGSST